MYTIITKIDINASVEVVWKVLTDFKNYHRWNTQLYFLEGQAQLGEKLTIKLEPMGHRGYTYRPRLNTLQTHRLLSWKGSVYRGGFFSVEHRFSLEPNTFGGTHLVNEEVCRGLLSPVMQMMPITKNTAACFDWFNEEVRDRSLALASKRMAS